MTTLINIKKLKAHEKTDKRNLTRVKNILYQAKYFTQPIIVEYKNFVILDGHHRAKALKNMGYGKIPAYLVDYQNKNIKVISRRPNIMLSKENIIQRALSGKPYPYKTSKHLIPHRPKNLKIKLEKLI